MPRYFRHYYSFSLERLNGTEYAAISMTRTGNRLTAADVSEWGIKKRMIVSILYIPTVFYYLCKNPFEWI